MTLARNGRHLVVDIHCHLNIPAAEEMMRPHIAAHAFHAFSCAASDEVNRQHFRQIGPKLNDIDERIADMDRANDRKFLAEMQRAC